MMTIHFAAKLSVLLEVSAMSEVSAMYVDDVRGLWSHSGVAPDAPVSLMLILVDPGSWCHSWCPPWCLGDPQHPDVANDLKG